MLQTQTETPERQNARNCNRPKKQTPKRQNASENAADQNKLQNAGVNAADPNARTPKN